MDRTRACVMRPSVAVSVHVSSIEQGRSHPRRPVLHDGIDGDRANASSRGRPAASDHEPDSLLHRRQRIQRREATLATPHAQSHRPLVLVSCSRGSRSNWRSLEVERPLGEARNAPENVVGALHPDERFLVRLMTVEESRWKKIARAMARTGIGRIRAGFRKLPHATQPDVSSTRRLPLERRESCRRRT